MTPPMLRQLRHDVWATEQLLERCRALTKEQLELTVPGTYGGIRRTFVHIVAAAERYLTRFMKMPEPLLSEDRDAEATLDEIAAHLPHLEEGVEKLFAGQEFDPDRVIDKATFENPHQYAEGVQHVLVNGKVVIKDGEHTGARPGMAIYGARFGRYPVDPTVIFVLR